MNNEGTPLHIMKKGIPVHGKPQKSPESFQISSVDMVSMSADILGIKTHHSIPEEKRDGKIRAVILAIAFAFIITPAFAAPVSDMDIDTAREFVQKNFVDIQPSLRPLSSSARELVIDASNIDQDPAHFNNVLRGEGKMAENPIAMHLWGMIYLSPNFYSAADEGYLIHETVHYAQRFFGLQYPCHAAMERPAYEMQNRWNAAHDLPLMSEEFISRISSCNRKE